MGVVFIRGAEKDEGRDAPEPILKLSRHVLEISHPTRASSLSPLSLLAPFVAADLRRRVATRCASWSIALSVLRNSQAAGE